MNNPIIGTSFAQVYKSLLQKLLYEPEFVSSPRGQQIHEFKDHTLIITDPRQCYFNNERRSTKYDYVMAEILWYLSGDNNKDFIEKYASMWNKICNPDDATLNSAYGYLIFRNRYSFNDPTQWQWAVKSLQEDKDTRQAVMHFNGPQHQFTGNKDFVCTMYANFLIRNNKLHLTVHMRSNDVVLGLPTDIPFFCLLQLNMHRILKEKYPDLKLGEYTHIVNSLHLYERNAKLVEEMLHYDFKPAFIEDGAENVISVKGYPHKPITDIYNACRKGVYDSSIAEECKSAFMRKLNELNEKLMPF